MTRYSESLLTEEPYAVFNTPPHSSVCSAAAFSYAAHGSINQRRKYTDEPYFYHPQRVAKLVSNISNVPYGTGQMQSLAYLHDVVEDTPLTIEDIRQIFSQEITEGVWFLTNVPVSAGNRRERFLINANRLRGAGQWIQNVKVADLIDNTESIVHYDPKFAVQYLKEKEELLYTYLQGAHLSIWKKAQDQLSEKKFLLGIV